MINMSEETNPTTSTSPSLAMSKFRYNPLPPGFIRVVTVLAPSATTTLTIKITHQPLKSGDFHALSYRWGDPAAGTRNVSCDDSSFVTVTLNLYEALQATRAVGGNVLWIDQLCINQSDLEERAAQVKIMGKIYSGCKQVRVWLSKDVWEDTRLLGHMELLMKLTASYDREKADGGNTGISRGLRKEFEAIPPDVWNALAELINQDYWARVWIIQELILSPETCVMVGGAGIRWDDHLRPLFGITDCEFFNSILTPDLRFHTRAITKISTMHTRLRWSLPQALLPAKWQTKWTLLDLVLKTWNFGATDARDRVYALLGLLDFSSQIKYEEVLVDYTATIESILFQTFVRGITDNVNPSLEALYYSHPLTSASWPSWIPEIGKQLGWSCELGYHFALYAAGGSGNPGIKSCPNHTGSLQIRTRHVGNISAIAAFDGISVQEKIEASNKVWKVTTEIDSEHREISKRFQLAYKLFLDQSEGGVSTCDVEHFVRAYLCGLGLDERHRISDADKEDIKVLTLLASGTGPFMAAAYALRSLGIGISPLDKTYRRSRDLRFCTLARSENHAQGRSQHYPLMGWMQQGVELHDEVHVIPGFPFPMLMRKISGQDRYRFAGVCFVYQFMDGEAFNSSDDDCLLSVI